MEDNKNKISVLPELLEELNEENILNFNFILERIIYWANFHREISTKILIESDSEEDRILYAESRRNLEFYMDRYKQLVT